MHQKHNTMDHCVCAREIQRKKKRRRATTAVAAKVAAAKTNERTNEIQSKHNIFNKNILLKRLSYSP